LIGSTQLRLEAIDALELHFDIIHEPRPLADQARDFLTGKLGLNPVPYRPPMLLQVKPPVLKDATAGFILSWALEVNGRPFAFAFTSTPPQRDGSEVFLTGTLLKHSLNYRSLAAGQAFGSISGRASWTRPPPSPITNDAFRIDAPVPTWPFGYHLRRSWRKRGSSPGNESAAWRT
jgi:hypothetical protein